MLAGPRKLWRFGARQHSLLFFLMMQPQLGPSDLPLWLWGDDPFAAAPQHERGKKQTNLCQCWKSIPKNLARITRKSTGRAARREFQDTGSMANAAKRGRGDDQNGGRTTVHSIDAQHTGQMICGIDGRWIDPAEIIV